MNPITKILLGAATTLALLLTGCSADTTPEPEKKAPAVSAEKPAKDAEKASEPEVDVDAVFLTVLRDEYPRFSRVPDDALLDLGHEVCVVLDAGLTLMEVAAITIDAGFTPKQAGFLIGAATAAFCPNYTPEDGTTQA